MSKGSLSALWAAAMREKTSWLAPIVVMLILLALMLGLSRYDALAPFIYSWF